MKMMFLYRTSVKANSRAIQALLKDGWTLYSINEDKAYFRKDVNEDEKEI
jgi:hypothetical protein